VSDRVAKQVISIGGIGTILVVLLVVLVLLGNVLPMFRANTIEPLSSVTFLLEGGSAQDDAPVAIGADEYAEILWVLHRSGVVSLHSIETGKQISVQAPPANSTDEKGTAASKVTCAFVAENDASLFVGYESGEVRAITIAIDVSFVKTAELEEDKRNALQSGVLLSDGVIYRSMPSGVVRKQSVSGITFHPTSKISDKPITVVDWKTPQTTSSFDNSQTWTWGASDGQKVVLGVVDNKVNSFSGEISQETKMWTSPAFPDSSKQRFIALMAGARSEHIESLDSSGRVVQWTPEGNENLAETLSHMSLAGSESTAKIGCALLGRSTMMIGSESGHIESVSLTSMPGGQELRSIHRFAGGMGAVTHLAASPEGRLVVGRFDTGKNAIYYVPTNRKLLEWSSAAEPNVDASLFFSANAACVGCVRGDKVDLWRIQIPYPEASIGSFFGKVWYEGYPEPQHVWQSSTGTVEGEYKFGFMPLIFGTLKATFYSMLIGAPIALMAAIFGSEFMDSRWRARVKPFIELMASVPSVVLGFVGALVLAPILRDNLMFVLVSVVTVLFLFIFAAHLWLTIPGPLAIRLSRLRLPILFILIPTGILIANVIAGTIESVLFGGNLVQWLSNTDGSGWAGWFCLWLLPSSLFVAWMVNGPISPFIQSYARRTTSFRFSLINLGILGVSSLAVLIISAFVAWVLSVGGLDPRGTVLGPYQERNALLVGAILGFAIIPLIYTISEDALQSVPKHLRSASLGCGATTWQTTMRVVVPTAMSGLFSALMIGFGRAVGETMVVLMAAGNTPVMDINPMNGYRTLSATLATELPEAARGSTHYHTLFLAAFLLFCFTMVANTVAEIVRIRFRKRAYQL
jgi:phosphate transport system permease protein